MFDDDARLHNALNNFVSELLYNHYTETLWDSDYVNSWDRENLADEFVEMYISQTGEEKEITEADAERLSVYVAKEIDRLIPKMYFMELNYELSKRYTPLLVRRIYDIEGKEHFDGVKDIKYQFDHDFSEEQAKIKDSTASEKQVAFLKKLGKNLGYLLWHEEYLTKTYANQMIEYLSEKTYEEPVIFTFFFVSK